MRSQFGQTLEIYKYRNYINKCFNSVVYYIFNTNNELVTSLCALKIYNKNYYRGVLMNALEPKTMHANLRNGLTNLNGFSLITEALYRFA